MSQTPEDLDRCDRCGIASDTIHVGWFTETGYDGLCAKCLNETPRLART